MPSHEDLASLGVMTLFLAQLGFKFFSLKLPWVFLKLPSLQNKERIFPLPPEVPEKPQAAFWALIVWHVLYMS